MTNQKQEYITKSMNKIEKFQKAKEIAELQIIQIQKLIFKNKIKKPKLIIYEDITDNERIIFQVAEEKDIFICVEKMAEEDENIIPLGTMEIYRK